MPTASATLSADGWGDRTGGGDCIFAPRPSLPAQDRPPRPGKAPRQEKPWQQPGTVLGTVGTVGTVRGTATVPKMAKPGPRKQAPGTVGTVTRTAKRPPCTTIPP